MEERFREVLRASLETAGISASDLAREVGMDKAYFVDLLAGRKRTVSALAFMLASRRLGFDPWEVSGVERPHRIEGECHLDNPPPRLAKVGGGLVEGVGVVEEAAFRSGTLGKGNFQPIEGYSVGRQAGFEVRGNDYLTWGLPAGTITQTVSFRNYEAVGVAGRIFVVRRELSGLFETVLRRMIVDADGEAFLVGPSEGDVSVSLAQSGVIGIVVRTSVPTVL